MKNIWERVKNEISKKDPRLQSESQEIDGEQSDVWKWIKSAAASISPKKTRSVEEICSLKSRIDYFLSS